uniref:XS domain-containing protein n=1 Tax=Nymphaea colorata TaxID=210225 RepID=A0A5K1DSB4_9MAGN
MSSDENSDFSESELEDRVQKSYAQLKEGGIFRRNADGTFKCPFCLGKKKQDYRYKDILQHANGVANSPKSLEKAAKHRALEMILMEDAEQLKPSGPPMIDSRPPKRVRLERKEERFVWPWMAIVANIPTALENGAYVTNGKLKAQFSEFSPAKVTLMWDALGFRGMAVVEFEKNWTGFYCAISFEKSFELRCHGKTQWIESKKCDSSMYAWLAREDDYHNSDDYVKMQLHHGDLKTISELQEEEERKKNTLVDDLTLRIDEKNKDLQSSGEQLMEMTYSLNQFKSALERKDSEMARLLEGH